MEGIPIINPPFADTAGGSIWIVEHFLYKIGIKFDIITKRSGWWLIEKNSMRIFYYFGDILRICSC